jgi:hypothetical protein
MIHLPGQDPGGRREERLHGRPGARLLGQLARARGDRGSQRCSDPDVGRPCIHLILHLTNTARFCGLARGMAFGHRTRSG